jgi:hypothetical protein
MIGSHSTCREDCVGRRVTSNAEKHEPYVFDDDEWGQRVRRLIDAKFPVDALKKVKEAATEQVLVELRKKARNRLVVSEAVGSAMAEQFVDQALRRARLSPIQRRLSRFHHVARLRRLVGKPDRASAIADLATHRSWIRSPIHGVIFYCRVNGWTFAEIEAQLGIARATASGYMKETLESLELHVKEHPEDNPFLPALLGSLLADGTFDTEKFSQSHPDCEEFLVSCELLALSAMTAPTSGHGVVVGLAVLIAAVVFVLLFFGAAPLPSAEREQPTKPVTERPARTAALAPPADRPAQDKSTNATVASARLAAVQVKATEDPAFVNEWQTRPERNQAFRSQPLSLTAMDAPYASVTQEAIPGADGLRTLFNLDKRNDLQIQVVDSNDTLFLRHEPDGSSSWALLQSEFHDGECPEYIVDATVRNGRVRIRELHGADACVYQIEMELNAGERFILRRTPSHDGLVFGQFGRWPCGISGHGSLVAIPGSYLKNVKLDVATLLQRADAELEDRDNDGLADQAEVLFHADPLMRDTDSDGAPDGIEILDAWSLPNRKDSDGDGVLDGAEIADGRSAVFPTLATAGIPSSRCRGLVPIYDCGGNDGRFHSCTDKLRAHVLQPLFYLKNRSDAPKQLDWVAHKDGFELMPYFPIEAAQFANNKRWLSMGVGYPIMTIRDGVWRANEIADGPAGTVAIFSKLDGAHQALFAVPKLQGSIQEALERGFSPMGYAWSADCD